MAYVPLSTILASNIMVGLGTDSNFDELEDSQKIQIMNSAQQVICDLFNKNDKNDYLADTTETI